MCNRDAGSIQFHDIIAIFLPLSMVIVLTASAAWPADPAPSALPLDSGLAWTEDEETGPRCFEARVPSAGTWWLELSTSAPSTAPELMLLGQGDRTRLEGGLSVVERAHGLLLEVARPGDYTVCLTSQAPLGEVELTSTFVSADPDKGGDPNEAEPEPEG